MSEPGPDGLPLPDPRVIEELSRAETVGMRPYLRHLIDMGVVPDNSLTVAFLANYERARFAPEPIFEQDFQILMRMFAELLRSMTPVDLDLLDLDNSSYDYEFDESSIIHRDNPDEHHHHHHHNYNHRQGGEKASIPSTFSDSGSVRHHRAPHDACPKTRCLPCPLSNETMAIVTTASYLLHQHPQSLMTATPPTTKPTGATETRTADRSARHRPTRSALSHVQPCPATTRARASCPPIRVKASVSGCRPRGHAAPCDLAAPPPVVGAGPAAKGLRPLAASFASLDPKTSLPHGACPI